MMLDNVIHTLKQTWGTPRTAWHMSEDYCPELSCEFNDGALTETLHDLVYRLTPFLLPEDYLNFLAVSNGACLFCDKTYGQWGLNLYSVNQIARASQHPIVAFRQDGFIKGDVVIGEFLGDSDLLLLRCDQNHQDFGSVLVSLPLDERIHWHQPANSFSCFLEKYIASEGIKFWETNIHKF